MQKKIYITLIHVFLLTSSYAQLKTKWMRDIFPNTSSFGPAPAYVNIAEDKAGNYYVLHSDTLTSNRGINIMKLNKYGFVEWNKSFLTNDNLWYVEVMFSYTIPFYRKYIDVDTAGNIYTIAGKGVYPYDSVCIAKISGNGTLINYSFSQSNYAWGVKVGPDNNVVFVRGSAGSQYAVCKYDTALSLIWESPIPVGSIGTKTSINWDQDTALIVTNYLGTCRSIRMNYSNGQIELNNNSLASSVIYNAFFMNDGSNKFHLWHQGFGVGAGTWMYNTQFNNQWYRPNPTQVNVFRGSRENMFEFYAAIDSTYITKIDTGGLLVKSVAIANNMLSSYPSWYYPTNGFQDKKSGRIYTFGMNSNTNSFEFSCSDSSLNFISGMKRPIPYIMGTQIGDVLNDDASRTLIAAYKIAIGSQGRGFTLYNYCNDCVDNLTGKIFIDANNNCLFDSTEIPIEGLMMNVDPVNLVLSSDTSGVYAYQLPPGNFQLSPVLPGSLVSACHSFPVSVSVNNSTVTTQDIPLVIDSSFHDFSTQLVALSPAVPGHSYAIRVNVKNEQFFADSASLSVTLDSLVSFDSSSVIASSVNNRTYTFDKFVLAARSENSIVFYLATLSTAQLLDTLSFISNVTCFNSDDNNGNDFAVLNDYVLGPFDPNDKQVTPAGNITTQDAVLHYTIRFQNTGTFAARDVILLDTLDSDLDISSLQMLSASHHFHASFIADRVLQVSSLSINLPDSNSNEPLSHGFVKYSIRQKPNLGAGTQIKNTAYIYFDFNAPVATNSVLNTIISPVSVKEFTSDNDQLSVSPNPASSQLNLKWKARNKRSVVEIRNMESKLVYRKPVSQESVTLDVSSLPDGNYMVTIFTGNTRMSKKIVVLK